MRDPNRIDGYCNELNKMWSNCPDMRFGQFICNILGEIDNRYNKDAFYVEDEEFFKLMTEIPWLNK